MNEIQIFQHEDFGKVRVIEINGVPWFVGKDVAEVLGYAKPTDAISKHCKGVSKMGIGVQTGVKTDGTPIMQTVQASIIPESDVYRLIMRSKLPNAEKFEEWVVSVVLPSIRKTGGYSLRQPDSYMIDDPIERAKRWIEEAEEHRAEIAKRDEQLALQAPKVMFADTVASSKDSVLVGEMAKIAKQKGIDIGAKRLFKWLKDNGYVMKKQGYANFPTQKSLDLGVMEIKETTIGTSKVVKIVVTPKITAKGQIYFLEKLREWAESGNDTATM